MGKLSQIKKALDMSKAARMKRAAEQGFDTETVWYHGSTHDIKRFGGEPNPESHFGAGHYLTNDPYDADVNYAGEGPDLSQRIQLRAEQIASELDVDYDDPKALAQARAELKGVSDGVIYQVSTKLDKPFDISRDGDTFLEYRQREMDPKDYLDEADGDMDLAEELAIEDSYNFEPEGDLVDFLDALTNDPRIDDRGKFELIEAIREEAYDGGISGKRLDEIMREREWYAEDWDTGSLVNNEVYRSALESAGYDGVIHDGDIFQNMDIPSGTKHQIAFKPENIRSVNAAFDPENIGKNDLLGQADPKILPALAAGGAGAAFVQKRAEQGSSIAKQALETAGLISSSVVAGLAGNLSRLGGAINPFITPEESEAGAQALMNNLTYMPSEPNAAMEWLGEQMGVFSEDIQRGVDALNADESIPVKIYENLPRRGQMAAQSLIELL